MMHPHHVSKWSSFEQHLDNLRMCDASGTTSRLSNLQLEGRPDDLCGGGFSFSLSPVQQYPGVAPLAMGPPILTGDMSPTSSSSSDFESVSSNMSSTASSASLMTEAFLASKSRVLRLTGFSTETPEISLESFFYDRHSSANRLPTPVSLCTLREVVTPTVVWAVFQTHEEACSLLSSCLPSPSPSLLASPALEGDLEPYSKLRPITMQTPETTIASSERPRTLQLSSSNPELYSRSVVEIQPGEYTISTNPPNPRTTFRMGDWICNFQNCAAHNFGRNTSCIGCGNSRTHLGPMSPNYPMHSPSRPQPSPRFASSSQYNQNYAPVQPAPQRTAPPSPNHHTIPSKPAHPLLTPSGRSFAVGGKVQNVSSDPLSPCVMYWPDNEPLPEQGQIRPGYLSSIAQPPILNTGNRGPISHQPGDWICLKCNYLNWRRRKVCQTCLPYAEGNGDSISTAVQAERIALLTSVLAHTKLTDEPQVQRSQSMTPPDVRRPFLEQNSHPRPQALRSRSQLELGNHFSGRASPVPGRPIYQTSGLRQASAPAPGPIAPPSPRNYPEYFPTHHFTDAPRELGYLHAPAPAPLLPGFLQDMVKSPTLSPASTSSADLSPEEALSLDDHQSSSRRSSASLSSKSQKDVRAQIQNIWKLHGEESKSLNYGAPGSRFPGNMTPPQVRRHSPLEVRQHSPPMHGVRLPVAQPQYD